MLKGTLTALVQTITEVSIHGQRALDVVYVPAAQPCAPPNLARVGPEAAPPDLAAGDEVLLDFLVGQVVGIRRPAAGG
jgi:hypothetical protein